MNSKTSCFNKTIFLKNFRRLWPVWGIWLAALFFLLPFTVYNGLAQFRQGTYSNAIANAMEFSQIAPLIFIMSVITAVSVFSYLFHAKSSNMIHAFPISRKELYFTNYVSGILFLMIPPILMYLAALPGLLQMNFSFVKDILPGIGFLLAKTFILYTISVFFCILSGHVFAAILYPIIFNVLYTIIVWLIGCMLSIAVPSLKIATSQYNDTIGVIFSPLICLTTKTASHYSIYFTNNGNPIVSSDYYGEGFLLGYCIMAAALLIIGYMLYQKRALENAEEMSVFRALRPVTRWLVAVCGGLGSAYIIVLFIYAGSADTELSRKYLPIFLVVFVVFNFVWFMITDMVLKKAFRVFNKRFWREWAVCAISTTVLFGGICVFANNRIAGYVPENSNVTAAIVNSQYLIIADTGSEKEEVIRLQEALLDRTGISRHTNQDSSADLETTTDSMTESSSDNIDENIQIGYKLKNGKTILRSYAVRLNQDRLSDPNSVESILNNIESDTTSYMEYVFGIDYEKLNFDTVYLGSYEIKGKQAQMVFRAYEKDVLKRNVDIRTMSLPEATTSNDTLTMKADYAGRARGLQDKLTALHANDLYDNFLNGYVTAVSIDAKKQKNHYTSTVDAQPFFSKKCRHTIAALKKCGLSSKDINDEFVAEG